MKKFLTLALSFLFSISAFSQAVTMVTAGSPVTNTGVAASTSKVTGSTAHVTIQSVFTKTSGTLAGTATLQGSVDGVNYVTIPTASIVSATATYTVTDVANQSVVFVINRNGFLYYRISWTGTGTMAGTLASYILTK